MLLLMALVKLELQLAFAIIVGTRKHIDVRIDREISSIIFYCGLTMGVA